MQDWLRRIDATYRQHKFNLDTLTIIIWATVALIALQLLINTLPFINDDAGFRVNIITEVFGIGITVLIIERYNRRREENRREEEARQAAAKEREETLQRIIREMRSPSAQEGARAAEEARERGFLTDGSLNGTDFRFANLSKANLDGARMQNCKFDDAKLIETWLSDADVSSSQFWRANATGVKLQNTDLRQTDWMNTDFADAILWGCNLTRAIIHRCNLQNVSLWGANLTEVELQECNLENAIFVDTDLSRSVFLKVNLENALFENAKFDSGTILPDSGYGQAEAELNRYTDSEHPDFYRPSWATPPYDSSRLGRNPWLDDNWYIKWVAEQKAAADDEKD